MQNEENGSVPLPETFPEMGDRVLTVVSDGAEDYAVAGRVLAANAAIGYTRKELTELVKKDFRYQNICRKKLRRLANQPPIKQDIEEAEKESKRAFLHWQKLVNYLGERQRELERIESQRYQRMLFLAQNENSKSIRRIQAIMGLQHLKTSRVPVFRGKRSGRRVLPVEAIVATLQKPLECPESVSISESQAIPS